MYLVKYVRTYVCMLLYSCGTCFWNTQMYHCSMILSKKAKVYIRIYMYIIVHKVMYALRTEV